MLAQQRALQTGLKSGPKAVYRAVYAAARHRIVPRINAEGGSSGGGGAGDNSDNKLDEYVEALKKGGVDRATARNILARWKEAGADANATQLRRLFLRQSLAPVTASLVQLLFDGGAAFSIFMTAGFLALGPDFFGRVLLVFALDALSLYFALCVFFDVVTLTSVLLTTARLGTSPMAFYEAVKTIAASGGASGTSSAGAGLAIVDKARAAVSAVKVAQALDAISAMLVASKGGANSSVDTLGNLSAYLTLYRAESQAGFDPAAVGLSEAEAANIALAFGQFDLNDDGTIDKREFVQMLTQLGAPVSDAEAEAAMEMMDTNRDGVISFGEFASWWAARKGR